MIKIVLAEDHLAFSDGIAAYLQYDEDIKLLDTVQDGEALLKSVAKNLPEVVVTDLRMPKMDGIEAIKK